ncbi:poly [ADP-ribose] polymerase 10 [Carlito syrichta]|uniref:Poly [ADP-ribose] polymerase n=1 Tax=Carlito syrichta TaxID=1868482 RepID=A0A1U7TEU4_CARSF|nr:poly [ADP-ribose] polymerase 10 [Carlito syrichta]
MMMIMERCGGTWGGGRIRRTGCFPTRVSCHPRVAMAEVEAEAEKGVAVEVCGLSPDVPDELLTLYFENRRHSGGGPVLSWQRLGYGGILTFQEPADAERVLTQADHKLYGARLTLRPAPPRAPTRLLLQGLPPGITPQLLEQHVQALLCASGLPVQPCCALASPRPDRALVQLPKPLSEADVCALEKQAQNLGLEGASVSLSRVSQTRDVRVVEGTASVDLLLLELYLENERRSGGGPLEGLRSLPRHLGTIVSFQQWQVAERVLQRDHWLQDSELSLVPHYDVLEPEELASDASGGDHRSELGFRATKDALLKARGLARALNDTETVTVGSGEAPEQSEASLRTDSLGSLGQAGPVDSGPLGSLEQKGLLTLRPVGLPGQEGPKSLGAIDSPGPVEISPMGLLGQEGLMETVVDSPGQKGLVDPVEISMGSLEKTGPVGPGCVGLSGQDSQVEMVLSMEPGAMRFLQLYHEDLLVGLGDVALFPLEGSDVTGFRLCGALASCQVAEEFLQSLLGSISCHMLSLKHPGSTRFLLGPEGQHLLQELEAQFQCVFGTERLATAILDTDPEEVDPTEDLLVLPSRAHTLWPPDSTGSEQENMSLEEVRELLATLEGLNGEDYRPLELGEREPEEQPEEEATPGHEEKEPVAPSTGVGGQLEEEAELQLALHRSLEPQGQVAEWKEAAALQQALALSLLEQPLLEAEEPPGGETGSRALLVVHVAFEQDMDELERALEAGLEGYLWEETVGPWGHMLSTELRARLEQRHGVSVALRGDCTILRGFGTQPTRAARHLAALLAGPWNQSLAFPMTATSPTLPGQRLMEPLSRLEHLAESTREFQEVVQAFYDTLDTASNRIHIVRVERVSHPLLQQQYELHRERLLQRCEQHPAEQVLYHGTTASAVPDICAHGFNRSFCGRNGTLYGQGVYFAKRASLSVQDRYSPPDADGHKAVFVARVLTGDYGPGSRALRAPPLRAPGHILLRYDSAVDRLHQPSIFVIFHDTQALPTHLITCEHMTRASPKDPCGHSGHSPATNETSL